MELIVRNAARIKKFSRVNGIGTSIYFLLLIRVLNIEEDHIYMNAGFILNSFLVHLENFFQIFLIVLS